MQINEKLKEFGKRKFGSEHGWLKKFAEALDKSSSDLAQYLGPNSRRLPGVPLLKKLYDLGCDMNWLFADKESNTVNEKKEDYEDSTIRNLRERIEELENENKILKKKLDSIKKYLGD